VVFDRSNTPELEDNWIRALLEDRDGRLWIGTFGGGLTVREGERFVHYGEAAGMDADIVHALALDGQGRLLVGTQGRGLLRFEHGRFATEPGTEALAGRNVRALAFDREGALWIGTETGLFRRDPGSHAPPVRVAGLPAERVVALAAGREAVYAGTESAGLVEIAGDRRHHIAVGDGLAHERVWSLVVDADDNLWIGTDGGGLHRLSRGRLSRLSTRNGLANDYVWALLEDREKNLWIGTNGGGLQQLRAGRVVPWTTREGLPSDFVWSVLRAPDGALYVGTEDAGVARIEDGRVTTFGPREGFLGNARALLPDGPDALLVGGKAGLHRLARGRARRIPGARLAGERVFALARGEDGVLWIGTANGLRSLESGRLRDRSREAGLPPAAVTTLHPARDGSLWASTSEGLWRHRHGRFVAYGREQGLPGLYVTSVSETPDGTVWAGTRGGLVRVREGRVHAFTARHGLPDEAIMSVLLDEDGALWTGSNRGLFRIPLAELEEVAAGRRERVRARAFGLEDGMRSVEVNHAGSARFRDEDGTLWFATRGGLASVPRLERAAVSSPPGVRVEEVHADGQPLRGPPFVAPAGTRRLDLRFTALSFRSPSSLRLRHRLEGFDSAFVRAGADRVAQYTNLPPGPYRFEVEAASADGDFEPVTAAVALAIEPRIHETFAFRALAVLVIALAGPLFHRHRVRRLGRETAALERLVAARTAEVEAANARLAQLVREDALTGVANRRRFDEALDEEWRRAVRARTPLALILVDVDFFKAFNDRLGHPAGDACLQDVARAVREASHRAGELVARYGGEEFAVLLPGASSAGARAVAENLRQKVEALGVPHPDSAAAPCVTVSAGVAWAEPVAEDRAGSLVAAADRALYAAKQAGRNRVEAAAGPG
jgi:diguanylate cyclase (GGDEF)-like protein